MVYASDSSSLALLETLAQVAASTLPPSLVAVSIEIPDDVAVRDVREAELPANWRDAGNAECAMLGSQWAVSGSGLVLRVPSAVNSLDRNVLLNPNYAEISSCTVSPPVPVTYDSRLLALL